MGILDIILAVKELLSLAIFLGIIELAVHYKAIDKYGIDNILKRPGLITDLSYFLISRFILGPIIFLSMGVIVYLLIASGLDYPQWDIIERQPFLVKLFLALYLADLAGYWRHRFMHTKHFWNYHATHHSPTKMDWLSFIRFHPFNTFINSIISFVVLYICGLAEFIPVNAAVRYYYGYFLHANIPWKYGILKYIFVSPVFHRWHHSTDKEARDKNFTVLFAINDLMFGTFYMPDNKVPDKTGVSQKDYPQGIIGQFIYPFQKWRKKPVISSEK